MVLVRVRVRVRFKIMVGLGLELGLGLGSGLGLALGLGLGLGLEIGIGLVLELGSGHTARSGWECAVRHGDLGTCEGWASDDVRVGHLMTYHVHPHEGGDHIFEAKRLIVHIGVLAEL